MECSEGSHDLLKELFISFRETVLAVFDACYCHVVVPYSCNSSE